MGIVASILLGLILGVAAAGAMLWLYLGRPDNLRRLKSAKPSAQPGSLPRQWPMAPRPLANSSERHVWRWLQQEVFPQMLVLPKLPLTRFTMPSSPDGARQWFSLLSSAYCSFTVCTGEARVLGCVDILTPTGPTRENQQIKRTLLEQCGMAYHTLRADALPDIDSLRAEFMARHDSASGVNSLHSGHNSLHSSLFHTGSDQLETVRNQLHEVLDRNRHERQRRRHAAAAAAGAPLPTGGMTPWPQANSFLGELDSRTGELREG